MYFTSRARRLGYINFHSPNPFKNKSSRIRHRCGTSMWVCIPQHIGDLGEWNCYFWDGLKVLTGITDVLAARPSRWFWSWGNKLSLWITVQFVLPLSPRRPYQGNLMGADLVSFLMCGGHCMSYRPGFSASQAPLLHHLLLHPHWGTGGCHKAPLSSHWSSRSAAKTCICYESLLAQILSPGFFPKERDLQLKDHTLKAGIYA